MSRIQRFIALVDEVLGKKALPLSILCIFVALVRGLVSKTLTVCHPSFS